VTLVVLLHQAALFIDTTSTSSNRSSASTTTAISSASSRSVDALWGGLPFTPVVRHPSHASGAYESGGGSHATLEHTEAAAAGSSSSSSSVQPAQEAAAASQQHQALTAPEPDGSADADNSSSSSSSSSTRGTGTATKQQQPGPLPVLLLPVDPGVALLRELAAAAVWELDEAAVRVSYAAAFAAVAPPIGYPPWQVKLPAQLAAEAEAAAEAAKHAHKGAQFYDGAGDAAGSSGKNAAAGTDQAAHASDGDAEDDGSHALLELLKATLSQPGPTAQDATDIAAAAAAATAFLQQQQQQQQQQGGGTLTPPPAARAAAQHLAHSALLALRSSARLAPCGMDDASLPLVLPAGQAPRKTLVALTLTEADGDAALPNLVLQLLQVSGVDSHQQLT
jgi:hypothetical protein